MWLALVVAGCNPANGQLRQQFERSQGESAPRLAHIESRLKPRIRISDDRNAAILLATIAAEPQSDSKRWAAAMDVAAKAADCPEYFNESGLESNLRPILRGLAERGVRKIEAGDKRGFDDLTKAYRLCGLLASQPTMNESVAGAEALLVFYQQSARILESRPAHRTAIAKVLATPIAPNWREAIAREFVTAPARISKGDLEAPELESTTAVAALPAETRRQAYLSEFLAVGDGLTEADLADVSALHQALVEAQRDLYPEKAPQAAWAYREVGQIRARADAYLRERAMRSSLQAVLFALEFRDKKGKWPVGTDLPKTSLDPYSLARLRVTQTEEAFAIYSVGANAVDDGGPPHSGDVGVNLRLRK